MIKLSLGYGREIMSRYIALFYVSVRSPERGEENENMNCQCQGNCAEFVKVHCRYKLDSLIHWIRYQVYHLHSPGSLLIMQ